MDSTFTIFQTDCSSPAQCSGEGDHWNRSASSFPTYTKYYKEIFHNIPKYSLESIHIIISNLHEMLTIALIVIPTRAKCAGLLMKVENQENDRNDTNC